MKHQKLYDDGLASLYLADARDMSFVEDGSVDVICTSPPYWSLRKYGQGAELVWDGEPQCDHVWGDTLTVRHRGQAHGQRAQVGNTLRDVQEPEQIRGQFCQLCGAWRGQLGLEPTIELYLNHLLQILDTECGRVLKDTGVMWVNMGDSYAASSSSKVNPRERPELPKPPGSWATRDATFSVKALDSGLKPLDLCMVPARFALAMQQRGWYLRSVVVWAKPNPMPESVNGWRWERHKVKVGRSNKLLKQETNPAAYDVMGGGRGTAPEWADCPGCPKCLPNDGLVLRKGSWRPTTSHEYIFMFTKTDSYYCDGDAVREPHTASNLQRQLSAPKKVPAKGDGRADFISGTGKRYLHPAGRNLRSVWEFPTQSYPEAHFATFALELPERCIKASTSQKGNCPKCGAPWVRVVERTVGIQHSNEPDPRYHAGTGGFSQSRTPTKFFEQALSTTRQTLGWRPSCECHLGLPRTKRQRKLDNQQTIKRFKEALLSDWAKAKADPLYEANKPMRDWTDDVFRTRFEDVDRVSWEWRARRHWLTKALPALVCDPFVGSGTSNAAATKLGRRSIGMDIVPEYIALAIKRLGGPFEVEVEGVSIRQEGLFQ